MKLCLNMSPFELSPTPKTSHCSAPKLTLIRPQYDTSPRLGGFKDLFPQTRVNMLRVVLGVIILWGHKNFRIPSKSLCDIRCTCFYDNNISTYFIVLDISLIRIQKVS